jgi:hypothetical protein
MDTRSAQIQRLQQAERHICVGREHIARQREIVSQLGQEGLDTGLANRFLACLLEIQAAHEDNRQAALDEIE